MQSGLFWKSKPIYTSILSRKNYRLIIIIFHKRVRHLDPVFGDSGRLLAGCKKSEKKMHDKKEKLIKFKISNKLLCNLKR